MSTYWKDGEPNWRHMEAMARRGWARLAAGVDNADNWGNLGGNFRIGRMLASGDLRLVALYLIEEQPRHGYDLIKAIEDRSGGFYAPSPGVVYPALTFLAKAGEQMQRFREFAKADWSAGRDDAAAPDSGHANAADADRDLKGVVPELNDARRALKVAIKTVRRGSEDQQHRAAAILRRAAADIEALSDEDVDI